MQKLNSNAFVSVGLVVCGILYFAWIIFQNKTVLFHPYNAIHAEKIYKESQWQKSQNVAEDKILDEWAIKNGYTGWKNYEDIINTKLKIKEQKLKIIKDIQSKGVSDSFLYSYAGYNYIHGANPSLLNPEHPPLAKYLIGFSILLFGNEHAFGIIVALLSLFLIAVISFQMRGSLFHAAIALFLTSLFPLFSDQIVHGPQLELYQLFFFLLVVFFLLLWQKKKQCMYYIAAGIVFGLLLSTKTLLPFFLLFSAWLIISFSRQWKVAACIIGIGILTFIITYYQFFALGGTFRSFLGLQKYIFIFYGGAHIPLFEFAGNYLRLIFTGTWKFWDSQRTVSAYSEWSIVWPIIFIAGMWRLIFQWKSKKNIHVLIFFIVLYNLFVFIVPIFPRYLLLLFVPLIILL